MWISFFFIIIQYNYQQFNLNYYSEKWLHLNKKLQRKVINGIKGNAEMLHLSLQATL